MVRTTPFFDAHLHVIDPRFPLVANQHFTPAPYRATAYRHEAAQLLAAAGYRPSGGAVVSGSFQATDQTYLLDALTALGPQFVGVTQLDADTPDEVLVRLDAAGVRATRVNLVRRVHSDELVGQLALARRARALVGWHLELYVRSTDLQQLRDQLPDADGVVVDHLGLTTAGLPHLLRFVADGGKVKATGFARGDLVVEAALAAIHRIAPGALLAGTDLPGTRAPRAVTAADLVLLGRLFSGEDLERVTSGNARALYRPAAVPDADDGASSGASAPTRRAWRSGQVDPSSVVR